MTVIQFLTDDSVLAVGVPACVFLVGYAATIWWMAARGAARLRTWVFAAATVGALALHLGWMVAAALVAGVESLVAVPLFGLDDPVARTVLAPDPSYLDYLNGLAYLAGAVLWPVACGLVCVAILLAGRRVLNASLQSVLIALIVGGAATTVPLAVFNVADVLALIPDLLRIVGLLALLAVAVTFVVAAGAGARTGW